MSDELKNEDEVEAHGALPDLSAEPRDEADGDDEVEAHGLGPATFDNPTFDNPTFD